MKNKIYTVYIYTDKSTGEKTYLIDLHGVSDKIKVSEQQCNEILKNAKENNYCRHTQISCPEWRPGNFSYKTHLDLYVIG